MNKGFYGRRFLLNLTKSGELRIRDRRGLEPAPRFGQRIEAGGRKVPVLARPHEIALPIFSVHTREDAEALRARLCALDPIDRVTYVLSLEHRAGKTSLDIEDLPRIGVLLQTEYTALRNRRRTRKVS